MTTASVTKGRSLTAAAQILHSRRVDRSAQRKPKKSAGAAWQQAAWDYYDVVGEYALGVDMLAWGVAQTRLVSARENPGSNEPELITGEPSEDGTVQPSRADQIAADLVAGFAGGSTGQQQLMKRVATQLVVAAESFIVGRGRPDGEDDIWEAYSREEVRFRNGGYTVDDGVEKFDLGDDDVMIRVWIPSPRRRQEPRSSSKSLLPILAEIDGLTKAIQANNDSRLAGAGIIIWPDSVELIGGTTAGDDDDETDPFLADVSDMMITPIQDRESAAAIVPIMVKVPTEAVGKIQWLVKPAIASPKDAEDREIAIRRMARAMDLPPEQILGSGESNHWGMWMVAEDTVKGPISSFASIIVHAVTISWYQEALKIAYEEAGISDDELVGRMMWFDTTSLEQRPDRSDQAVDAFDRGGQTLEALVRELGLDPAEIPDGDELVRILLFLVAKADPAAAVKLLTDPSLIDRIVGTAKTVDEIEPPDEEAEPTQEDTRELPTEPDTDTEPTTGAAA
jgi:hypothetical protein